MSLLKLTWGIAGLLLIVSPSLGWAGQAQAAAPPFVGEYFVTENKDDICVPYTRNLNQFRRLDFNACHPRLSAKYPAFTRPAWEEIPFDLALAETIFKNPPVSPENAERWWRVWLKASAALRAEGKLKLWRTQIDIDGDGAPETLVRLDYLVESNQGREEQGWQLQQTCPYGGRIYMLDSANESMRRGFNHTAYRITDIIHYSDARVYPGQSNGYYGVDHRFTLPTEPDGPRIGATRGMNVYASFNQGSGKACQIDWVPTGHYRPLKRIGLQA